MTGILLTSTTSVNLDGGIEASGHWLIGRSSHRFIGREEESNLLLKRWEEVQEGRGHMMLLSGEAGIGKSRLIQELKEQLREQSICIETHCSPYHQQSAFYPVIDYIQRSLQFSREETNEAKRQKLERVMTRAHLEDAVPVVANLLSLPFPTSAYSTLTPQRQREKLLQVIVSWFFSLTRHKPVLTVWEDLHWADPSTLEWLGHLIEHVVAARLLVVLTFRPEFVPPWPTRSHLRPLTLSRFMSKDSETMIAKVVRGKKLPDEVVEQIVIKTDGVPLFVEESTKMILESGLLQEHQGAYVLTGPLPPLAIPVTVHDSLIARLDRLGAAREVAQLGATCGREFSYELIKAVSPLDEPSLRQALEKLVRTEVLYPRGIGQGSQYVFKHALIQDAAYQSLLKSKRQQYHQQIAYALEAQFPETKEAEPELLAHHYTEAGLSAQAVPYWHKSGQGAIQRSANAEAISHLKRALALLPELPDNDARVQLELALQTALGVPLMATKGYAAPEVESAYARARELCRHMGGTPQLFHVLGGLFAFYLVRGKLHTARTLAEQCLRLGENIGEPTFLLEAHRMLGNILIFLASFPWRCVT